MDLRGDVQSSIWGVFLNPLSEQCTTVMVTNTYDSHSSTPHVSQWMFVTVWLGVGLSG